ncbi:hypothetical protein PFISCL1PPCAC_2448, partial [Pristionchus fissidentatus]
QGRSRAMSSAPQTPSDSTPLATRVSLENGLRSKLTGMENAIARVASVKARLRKNAELARRDLSLTISAQMEALRHREQQLIHSLEEAVQRKEGVLASQQENLNLHIGACQQSLESLRRASPTCTQKDVDVQEMLFRLSAVDMEPRANDYVSLQADTVSMRGAIGDWGRIVEDGDERRETRKAGESLPVEMEDYDDSPLAHKSLMWSGHRKRETKKNGGEKREGGEGNVGSAVRDWLANMRPSAEQVLTADIGRVMEDVEQKSSGTSCDSTFEVIDPSAVIDAILKSTARPLSDWLPTVVPRSEEEVDSFVPITLPSLFAPFERREKKSTATPTTTPVESSPLPGLRAHPSLFAEADSQSVFSHPSLAPSSSSSIATATTTVPTMLYEFESVIGRLMKSGDDQWLTQPSSSSSSIPPSAPSSSPAATVDVAPTVMMGHAEAIERLARETEKMRLSSSSSHHNPPSSPSSSDFVHPTSTVYSGAPAEFADQWQRVFGRGGDAGDKWLAAKSS